MIKSGLPRMLTWVLITCLACGCATPASIKGLDTFLSRKSFDEPALSNFRCTRGAHRGASVMFVENTMEALKEADKNDRYAFIEFDVQYSRDKKIMVFHDKRMLRLYGNLKSIGKTSAEELVEISDGNIAEYNDVMDVLHKKINIEIKSRGDNEEDRQLVDEIMADLSRRKREKDAMISSISRDVVIYLNQTYPEMPSGQIFWITSSTYLHWDGLTRRLFDEIGQTGADYLILYTANLGNMNELFKLKPRNIALVFWDFDDTIFMVHKDLTDRMWGTSVFKNFFQEARFRITGFFHGSPDISQ